MKVFKPGDMVKSKYGGNLLTVKESNERLTLVSWNIGDRAHLTGHVETEDLIPHRAETQIYTARVSYRGPDRLDITRKAGSVYGPSWALLGPMLTARRDGKPMDWPAYKAAYLREMQAVDLAPLLSKGVVTLCCYCTSKTECHRYALAELLVQHGAVYLGERGSAQQSLF